MRATESEAPNTAEDQYRKFMRISNSAYLVKTPDKNTKTKAFNSAVHSLKDSTIVHGYLK